MNQSLREKIIQRMNEFQIEPKRSLGQNFLVSDHVVHKILAAAKAEEFQTVVEVGPGLGALTDGLAACKERLTLVELDSKFADYWRQQNFSVLEMDALKVDWEKRLHEKTALLVSNLPYQISSRLVVELSMNRPSFSRMVLMFQKEVALRLLAEEKTSDYGLLSVIGQTYWRIRPVVEAGAVDFLPKPNVASRVLLFDQRPWEPSSPDPRRFLSFLKVGFTNRRKMLLPKLVSFHKKERLEEAFHEMGLNFKIRAEALSPKDWMALFSRLDRSP